jgi:spore coat protein U-like protein
MKTIDFKISSTRLVLTLSLAIGGAGFGVNSFAATATDNLAVSATVAANCTISTAAVSFGAYDPVGTHSATNLDATGTVTTTCTNGSAVTVILGQGANADTGSTDAVPLRRMTDATNFLAYFLFSESGRTTVWGNTAGTGLGDTGTGSTSDLTVYGRVGSAQNVPVGSYSDTVVATVTF